MSFEATYVGDDSGTFWIDLNVKPLGASNVGYKSFDAYCGVIPNDADTLLLIAEPTFFFNDDRTFLAVRSS